jgi:transcriptional regulator NrdR family protein
MTEKFYCPVCKGYHSRVINSRPDTTGEVFIRWRECSCGHRFATEERIVSDIIPPEKKVKPINI